MSRQADPTQPVVLVEGAPPVPASWPPDTRSRMLAAMACTVVARGYAQTTVHHVIALAIASRRTFYVHFDNREACLLAAYDAIHDDMLAIVSLHHGGLRPTLEALLRYFAVWPAHARVVTTEILAVGPAGLVRHEQTMGEMAKRLADCLPARATADAPLGADELLQAAVGGVFRIVQRRVLADRELSLPDLAGPIATLVSTP